MSLCKLIYFLLSLFFIQNIYSLPVEKKEIIVISDLHNFFLTEAILENLSQKYYSIVIAGDLENMTPVINFLKKRPEYPLVFMPGDHDIKDYDFKNLEEDFKNTKMIDYILTESGSQNYTYVLNILKKTIDKTVHAYLNDLIYRIIGKKIIIHEKTMVKEKIDILEQLKEKIQDTKLKNEILFITGTIKELGYYETLSILHKTTVLEKLLRKHFLIGDIYNNVKNIKKNIEKIKAIITINKFLIRPDVQLLKKNMILNMKKSITLYFKDQNINIKFKRSILPLDMQVIAGVSIVPYLYFGEKIKKQYLKHLFQETFNKQYKAGRMYRYLFISHVDLNIFKAIVLKNKKNIPKNSIFLNGHTHFLLDLSPEAASLQALFLPNKNNEFFANKVFIDGFNIV